MLFIFVYPGIYLAGLFLAVVSVARLGSSFVLLNSFLPLPVANHPLIRGKSGLEVIPLDRHRLNASDEDVFDEDTLDGQDPLIEHLEADELLDGLP